MVEDESGQSSKLSPDARLESLDRRLDQAQQEEADDAEKEQSRRVRQFGQRMAGQMIGAPAGGLLLGWGLDTLFSTKPLWMIVLMLIGFAVGIRNVYYWTKNTPSSIDERPERGKDQ
ncbi:MAG: AtpZ/AtpI family protein [Pseudomonadota bacterium]